MSCSHCKKQSPVLEEVRENIREMRSVNALTFQTWGSEDQTHMVIGVLSGRTR